MPAPKNDAPDPYEAEDPSAGEAEDAYDLGALAKRGDVAGLLLLAKAYRAGSAPGGRDLAKCLETYRAAAELGSAEAEYAVALFHMNGTTVVAQDLRQGALHLRAAAEKGSVAAKVYLGNLYELGIHYKADSEKADVWYRNAARAAHLDSEEGEGALQRGLAELGCARHALELGRAADTSEEDKQRLTARARAHGLGLRIREGTAEADRATFVDALASAETMPTGTPPPVTVQRERDRKDTSPETRQAKEKVEAKSQPPPPLPADPAAKAAAARTAKKRAAARTRLANSLGAFAYALLFAIVGVAAGYAASLGAQELIARGHLLPVVGSQTRLVFPIVLGVLGVLPAWLVYRLSTVLKAIAMGAVVAGLGWVAWGTGGGALHSDRALQALAFGMSGFLAGLLVLGLLGGAKQPRPQRAE